MHEQSSQPSRRRLLVGSGCALGAAVVALLGYSVLAPSVRARATTGPQPVNAAVIQPGLDNAPPASPASPPPADPVPEVEGWPASVTGRVRDVDGQPLA